MWSCLNGEIHSSLRVWNSSSELGVGSTVIGDSIDGVGAFSSTGLDFSMIGFVVEGLASSVSGASDGVISLNWFSDSLLVKKEPTFWK